MKPFIKISSLMLSILIAPIVLSAAIIHVPIDQPTIQAGISAAQTGDTVLVASGTYSGDGNRDITFLGKSIVLQSEEGPETSIIDCQASPAEPHRAFYLNDDEDSMTVIDGFTLTHAYSEAVFIRVSSPTVRNCIIRENDAGLVLGNGYYAERRKIKVENCLVAHNTGTGIWDFHNGMISDCEVSYNGTGVYLVSPIALQLSHLLIRDNKGNGVEVQTGSVGDFSIINNTVYGNNKGLYFYYDLPVSTSGVRVFPASRISNNVFAFNADRGVESGGQGFGSISVSCNNSFGNQGGDWNPIYSWDPRAGDSNGNFSANPLFCDTAIGDFRLALNSSCTPANNVCGVLIGTFDVGCGALFICGDADSNGSVNILDVAFLIKYLYKGGPAPNCP